MPVHKEESSEITDVVNDVALPQQSPENTTPETPAVAESSAAKQPKPNRCWNCSKRVGLTGFKCRCGYVFCGEHRYSDKHGCTFDYKSAQKQAVAKANPVVVASKMDKI